GYAMAAVVDDDYIPRRGGIDDLADLEVLGSEVTAPAGDLAYGHGTPDAARTRHHLGEAGEDTLEFDVIESIGDGRRRQPRKAKGEVWGCAHRLLLCRRIRPAGFAPGRGSRIVTSRNPQPTARACLRSASWYRPQPWRGCWPCRPRRRPAPMRLCPRVAS